MPTAGALQGIVTLMLPHDLHVKHLGQRAAPLADVTFEDERRDDDDGERRDEHIRLLIVTFVVEEDFFGCARCFSARLRRTNSSKQSRQGSGAGFAGGGASLDEEDDDDEDMVLISNLILMSASSESGSGSRTGSGSFSITFSCTTWMIVGVAARELPLALDRDRERSCLLGGNAAGTDLRRGGECLRKEDDGLLPISATCSSMMLPPRGIIRTMGDAADMGDAAPASAPTSSKDRLMLTEISFWSSICCGGGDRGKGGGDCCTIL